MVFIALPDQQVPEALLTDIADLGLVVAVDHPTGRPWVFADNGAALSSAKLAPNAQVAMTGVRADVPPGLTAASMVDVNEVAERACRMGHFLASVSGDVRVQGSLSTQHQVFWARAHGVAVASDSLEMLFGLVRPQYDKTSLALALVDTLPTHPFIALTMWQGIHATGIGDWLLLRPDAEPAQVRWWTDPDRDLDADAAAVQVRSALEMVLAESTAGRGTVSADLSGGLDSTSLCLLLGDCAADLQTFRTSSLNPANDETLRARAVAQELDLELKEFAPLAHSSSAFELTGGDELATLLEGPLVWAASRGYLETLAPALAEAGSTVHFTGLGGDELFDFVPGYFSGLWRESRGALIKAALRAREARKTPLRPLLAGVSSTETYQDRLVRTLDQLRGRAPQRPGDAYGWFPATTLPDWMSDEGKERVLTGLAEAIEACRPPLGRDPVAHQSLEAIAYQGKILRQFGVVLAEHDIAWTGPYTDDRVVQAALRAPVSARVDDRLDKPLLAAAVGRSAPPGFFNKRGRSDFTTDIYAEHRRRRRQLVEVFEDSALAEAGLIDAHKARAMVLEPASADVGLIGVERIATAERWLRDIATGLPNRELKWDTTGGAR